MNKIIYLDAAASALKSRAVIDTEMDFLREHYANAGRGVCARATAVDGMVNHTRHRVADFIGANATQIVFTSGTTDGMNRIVQMIRSMYPQSHFVVAVSDLDHHSARMPWQNLANRGECDLVLCPLNAAFDIDVDQIPVADVMVITAMSNVLGVPQDVASIIRHARRKNPHVITIIDAAQYVAHAKIDVHEWGCDFLCFSGHKIGADTGLGVMYIRDPDATAADKFGGGMVNKILDNGEFILNPSPEKFEAGTMPLTQISGLGVAIDEWTAWDGASELISYMYDALVKIPRINLLTGRGAALISFTVDGMHILDFGMRVGARGICMRVGNMCATWIHRALGIAGSARLSVGPWNTRADADRAIEIIRDVVGQ